MHRDHGLDGEAGGDQRTELPAVLVAHPPVGTDEGQHALRGQRPEPCLDERHVDVGPAAHRRIGAPVGLVERRRHVLGPDVRRVPDHEVHRPGRLGRQQSEAGRVGEEVVLLDHPRLRQALPLAGRPPLALEGLGHPDASLRHVLGEQVGGGDRRAGVGNGPPGGPARTAQAPDHGDQEGTLAAGRLYRAARAQVLVLRVPGQIQDQVDHPLPGEDLAPSSPPVGSTEGDGARCRHRPASVDAGCDGGTAHGRIASPATSAGAPTIRCCSVDASSAGARRTTRARPRRRRHRWCPRRSRWGGRSHRRRRSPPTR